MNISKLTLVYKFITGGRTGVMDYLFGKANTLVDKLPTATKDEIKKWLDYAKKLLACLRATEWLCPEKWLTAYRLTVDAFEAVVNAMEDLNLTQEELTAIVKAFQTAYAAWMAE